MGPSRRPGLRHTYPRAAPRDRFRDPAPPPPAAWVLACPNLTCDTELVVLSEQAGRWVECPQCAFRFLAPKEAPPEVVAALGDEPFAADVGPGGPGCSARAGAAADALSRLAGGFVAARTVDRPAERRAGGRAELAWDPVVDTTPPPAPAPAPRSDLLLVWAVTLVAVAGVIAAAVAMDWPDLGLAALVFLVPAVVKTVGEARPKDETGEGRATSRGERP